MKNKSAYACETTQELLISFMSAVSVLVEFDILEIARITAVLQSVGYISKLRYFFPFNYFFSFSKLKTDLIVLDLVSFVKLIDDYWQYRLDAYHIPPQRVRSVGFLV